MEEIIKVKMKIRSWDYRKNPLTDKHGNYSYSSLTTAIEELTELREELKKSIKNKIK